MPADGEAAARDGTGVAGPVEGSVLGVYDRHGAVWAGLRGERAAEGAWLDRFCGLLPAGAAVLDIGCGSGVPIARALVERSFAVTGLDGSATMLDLFRRNLPGSPAILSDMRRLALGQRFAGLVAWDSFFHLPPDDQRVMFARFRAHAAPGAALLFTSGESEGGAVGELEGEPLHHASLGPEEYRALLEAAGFGVVDHVARDPSCDRTVWLARREGCGPCDDRKRRRHAPALPGDTCPQDAGSTTSKPTFSQSKWSVTTSGPT